MALTRKFLTALGIDEDKADEIIKAHTETVDGLKSQIEANNEAAKNAETYKAKVDELQKKLDDADPTDWKEKYESTKTEYDNYKADVEKKATKSAKEAAYRQLLVDAGISEKRIATVLKVSQADIDGIELDSDGKIKTADKLTENIKTEWADFIVTTQKKGAEVSKPPANDGKGGTMTKDDILKIRDTTERQAAIREHPELFGIEID